MIDPVEDDNYNEWIELYNPTNKSINISNWEIIDNYSKDTIEPNTDIGNGTTLIPPKGYAIITDHGTKIYENMTISNNTICLYIDDKSIGNGLGNKGDKIILKNNTNSTIDSIEWITDYEDITGLPFGKITEGYSLSRYKNMDSNNTFTDFYENIIPTPGMENILFEKGETQIISEKSSFLIKKHEKININFSIKNIGRYNDNITLKIKNNNLNTFLDKNKSFLKPNEIDNITLTVEYNQKNPAYEDEIIIRAISEKKHSINDSISFFFEILASDLTIKKIKIYNEQNIETDKIYQGENIRMKGFLKNLGKVNATDADVCFYHDKIDNEYLIGVKNYESVYKYQKYPSLKLDTSKMKPGFHDIILVADIDNRVDEIDETNNQLVYSFELINTSPSINEKELVFSEFYYNTHPNIKNEYFTIFNPTNQTVNLSGFYVTNQPEKIKSDQNKIVFPNNTQIEPRDFLYITQKNIDFRFETGENADFEYEKDSDNDIPQMMSAKQFVLSNNGDMIALKNPFNHTVDLVCYGNISTVLEEWNGIPIADVSEGVILKRNFDKNNNPFDTDTCYDWCNKYREYVIGQSDFKSEKIFFNGTVRTFVSPDCSYKVITDELKKANKSVFLNVYEFTSFFLCEEIIDLLLRNLSVKLFLEGSPIGGISDEEKYLLNRIDTYGGEICFIKNNEENNGFKRYRFNHAKYLIIDNETVIIESCNWAGTGVPIDPSFGNREWGVVIKNKNVSNYYLDLFFDDYKNSNLDTVSFSDMNYYVSSDFVFNEKIYKGDYENSFGSLNASGFFSIKPVVSPDNSYKVIEEFLNSATESIYVQQLYIYKYWDDGGINPFVNCLVNKSKKGLDVRVILNYNEFYDSTNNRCNETMNYLCGKGVKVKFIYSNWSVFTNVHNKGVVVDNKSVLISSINWNENSVMNNRETGIIIENMDVAEYYTDVFFYDWSLKDINKKVEEGISSQENYEKNEYKNTIYIGSLFTLTFIIIANDWRKRKWT